MLPRRCASAARYCLHGCSVSMVCICWYSCLLESCSMLAHFASFPLCQVMLGKPLSDLAQWSAEDPIFLLRFGVSTPAPILFRRWVQDPRTASKQHSVRCHRCACSPSLFQACLRSSLSLKGVLTVPAASLRPLCHAQGFQQEGLEHLAQHHCWVGTTHLI